MKSRALQLGNVREQDGWGIVLSVILHGLLLLAVVLYQQFFSNQRQIFTPNYQTVSLVGTAPTTQAPKPAPPAPKPAPKPVDPPKPTTPPKPAEPPKPVTPPKPTAEPIANKPAEQPKPITPPKPDTSQELEQRLRDLQREQERRRAREAEQRARQQAEQARQRAEQARQQQALDDAIRRLEQDQALAASGAQGRAGSSENQIDPRLQAYNQQLHDSIYRNWIVPQGMNTKDLVVVINFNIRRDGYAERIWIEQSSGNAVFDQSGLRAAEKSNPFPAPPSVVRAPVYEVGIIFRGDSLNQ